MYQPWLIWAIVGVVCIGMEMLLPGFVIFFFGLGALLTALVSLIPFVSDATWLQVILFAVFSVISLVFLRQRFAKIFAGTVFDSRHADPEETGAGETAEVIETVSPQTDGRIRFQGTTWPARTRAGTILPGSRAIVIERNGMTYIIAPLGEEKDAEGVNS